MNNQLDEALSEEQEKRFESRKALLQDLVQYLTKIDTDTLEHTTVEEYVEGFWMQIENQEKQESKDFTLEG